MFVNYPLGDFLIRIKNASMANRKTVRAPYTKFLNEVAKTFVRLGFAETVAKEERDLVLSLTFHNKKPILKDLKVLSKPGYRRYINIDELKDRKNPATVIVSTPKGVLFAKEAIKKGVGGELLAEVL